MSYLSNPNQKTLCTLEFMKYIQIAHPWTKEVEIHPFPKDRKRLQCFRDRIFGNFAHILLYRVWFFTNQKYAN